MSDVCFKEEERVFSGISEKGVEETVLNRTFDCPFCDCIFFSEHDLALHLKAFSDVGDAHKDAFRRLHVFIEECGTWCLNDDFTQVEFRYPEQVIASLEWVIRSFFKLGLPVRKKFRRR